MVNDVVLFYLVYRLGPFILLPLLALFVFALILLFNPWTWIVLGLISLLVVTFGETA